MANPNIVEAGKATQITPETANEYRLKGLAIRKHLSDQRKVLFRTVTRSNGKGFWIPNEVEFTVPENCRSLDIYVNIGPGDANARAYVDNIVLTRQK